MKSWRISDVEFLYVDDLARASLFVALSENKTLDNVLIQSNSFINVGSGKEISIYELALKISNLVKYEGQITFDKNKPDGTPRKLLDSSLINSLGWKPEISLTEGLEKTYNFFKLQNKY